MKHESPDDGIHLLKRTPFCTLVKDNDDLAALRRDYAPQPARERRMAAEWEYDSHMASEIFEDSMALAGKDGLGRPFWPSGVVALAIDPLYAPAILTVGSIEYQLGHIEEAMDLFKQLTKLPKDEEDLSTIIDKAGDFLIDECDYENALALYTAAEKAYPQEAIYCLGAGYCLGKLGHYDQAVEKNRDADALDPDNYEHLNDLGYSLLEAGKLDEAEKVLKKSISLAPADYDLPYNNLTILREKRRRHTTPHE